MRIEYIIGAIVAIALIAGGILVWNTPSKMSDGGAASGEPSMLTIAEKETRYQKAPELVAPDGYINTGGEPITIEQFNGRNVVLVDFWTYSCINCQRTLPYLKEWYAKYKDDGLVVIGVHTPEFAFEKVRANVENAAKEFGLTYPIVQDNEYQTWNAFKNHYWPRKYLIDIDGYIVYDHAGEGAYEETEQEIQKALEERAERFGADMPTTDIAKPSDVVEVAPGGVASPEIYFGSHRNQYLGNGERGKEGVQTLALPEKLLGNTLYLGGAWDIQPEYAENTSGGARIQFLYSAKNVYMVASAEEPIVVTVTRDGGKPLGTERGADVNERGEATIHEDRLYKLIEGVDYDAHVIEITVKGPGLKAYTFTFG